MLSNRLPHNASVKALLAATSLFVVIAVAITWPQAARLATDASEHHDVYFNMWRMGWAAHAAISPGTAFLDGNIFFPERHTLTFSDAMPVASATAMPLLWLGVPPVLVHNLVLFAGILLSAVGIFVLARSLTGSAAAGATAGVVFGFAAYRFEHLGHMELQWTVWIPWAFWALERIRASGRWRDGALLGLFLALQFMSSIYYGIYLVCLMGVAIGCSLVIDLRGKRPLTGQLIAFAVAGAVALILCLPYAVPYLAQRPAVGDRDIREVAQYSATPASYLAASTSNVLYGAVTAQFGAPEKRLFPGLLPVFLAVACLVWRRTTTTLIYGVGLLAAFELSLGANGTIYPLLYYHAPGFSSLRAPARLGVFVLFFLGVLAAFGHAALARRLTPRMTRVLSAAIWIVLLAEYCVAPLPLTPIPNTPPPLYAWLALQPPGVVAELPVPAPGALPGDDARHSYMSTFHWRPLVNGYSGYYPESYLRLLERLRFPPGRSVEILRLTGVKYVIVHFASWNPEESIAAAKILTEDATVSIIGQFDDGHGVAMVFRLEELATQDK